MIACGRIYVQRVNNAVISRSISAAQSAAEMDASDVTRLILNICRFLGAMAADRVSAQK